MKNKKTFGSLLCACIVSVGMLNLGTGVANSDTKTVSDTPPIGWTISKATSIGGKKGVPQQAKSKTIQDFWTTERMLQARELPSPVATKSELSNETQKENIRVGLPGDIPPARPDSKFSPSAVFVSDAPTVGRLFFEDPTNGTLYRCSAAVVNAGNNRTVQTAAHCLFDPSRHLQYSGHFFVPGYVGGTAPYGGFDMSVYISHFEWKDNNKYHFDYGFMRMAPRDDGVNVQQIVGALGFSWNQNNDLVDLMGYPAQTPYDGEIQWRDFTNSTVVDYVEDGQIEGWFDRLISDFNPGSSGGPVVKQYNPSSRLGYSRGVNSFRFQGQPYVISPYFDGDAKLAFDFAGE
jgi:V8-like Glu-specific endopeptidase